MTTTYWAIGRRIVEHEQRGAHRAAYGEHGRGGQSAPMRATRPLAPPPTPHASGAQATR
ncbi:MAG: hypothetical protein ABTD50_24540 [Polyangiaceae bacterium]